MELFSEPYNATGGLAAEGVMNQLGRPDIEPLEVLVREAVQNCWDARRDAEAAVRVEIGRQTLDGARVEALKSQLLIDPPEGLPLDAQLVAGMQLLHFADFGTGGLSGPTRADDAAPGQVRDFVDFIRNIGQPPDKEFGGGSFGYGKAAFYIASRARTIIIDTLCQTPGGGFERRLIGCALGSNFERAGRPYTGRHWWGRVVNDVPEPLTGGDAADAAELLGLPPREGEAGLGTTIVVVAPGVAPEGPPDEDPTMDFIGEALAWNFWPKMTPVRGGRPTMTFGLTDDGKVLRVPDPKTHERLRLFVEAMDHLRTDAAAEDDDVLDREIECLRPYRRLGRLIVCRALVHPVQLPPRGVPQGARVTAQSLHHVAVMRNAELVVKYVRGAEPVAGRMGYAGVFRCRHDVDGIFRRAEPPTHDDWIYRAIEKGPERTFVKVGLERIATVCREAAGITLVSAQDVTGSDIPLGEFADALAGLMPGFAGPGARRTARRAPSSASRKKSKRRPSKEAIDEAEGWSDQEGNEAASAETSQPSTTRVARRSPQLRGIGEAAPKLDDRGRAVMRYRFELRPHGNRVRLYGRVEVMTSDGEEVESEAPVGVAEPSISEWRAPGGERLEGEELEVSAESAAGEWWVDVPIDQEVMMRVDLTAVAA